MGSLSPSLGSFTTKGLDLLTLVAACGRLVLVQSSLVDAWVTGSSSYQSKLLGVSFIVKELSSVNLSISSMDKIFFS